MSEQASERILFDKRVEKCNAHSLSAASFVNDNESIRIQWNSLFEARVLEFFQFLYESLVFFCLACFVHIHIVHESSQLPFPRSCHLSEYELQNIRNTIIIIMLLTQNCIRFYDTGESLLQLCRVVFSLENLKRRI